MKNKLLKSFYYLSIALCLFLGLNKVASASYDDGLMLYWDFNNTNIDNISGVAGTNFGYKSSNPWGFSNHYSLNAAYSWYNVKVDNLNVEQGNNFSISYWQYYDNNACCIEMKNTGGQMITFLCADHVNDGRWPVKPQVYGNAYVNESPTWNSNLIANPSGNYSYPNYSAGWHLITLTFTANHQVLYVDGLKKWEADLSIPQNYGNIGSIHFYPNNWAGDDYLFDDFALWNKTLNGDEVAQIYASIGGLENLSFTPPFSITSPENGEIKIKESWITVSGTCPTNGSDRIALTNDCSDFSGLEYTIDCVNNHFSSDFYYDGISDWVVAMETDSVAGDCVDYDDLMDGVNINGIEVIEGYPDDWYFNYDYYDDFDIEIVSPIFDMPALTLPLGSLGVDMSFSFVYPHPLSPFLVFNIKQYDENGNLLNDSYHNKALYEMSDTSNYIVNLTASSSPIHYVVQLLNDGDLVRQYPFGVFVSDLDLIVNPDEYRYLFPRLVEKLKKKVVFNYYFAFYDGFYSLFNGSIPESSDDALDITFKSVSGDGQYNLNVPIFKGSDPNVKNFAGGLRPYITAFLWLVFALYVVMRINGLFGKDE